MIRKAVVGIVFNGERFLVLHRTLGWSGWEFPKGGVNAGETEKEAVLREVKEETGLDAKITKKLPLIIRYDYPDDYRKKYGADKTEQSVFLLRANGKIKLSEEHDDYKWLSYEEARNILKYDDQKKALDAALGAIKDDTGKDKRDTK